MLAVIPAAFFVAVIPLARPTGDHPVPGGWLAPFTTALVATGVFAVASAELLSLVGGIRRPYLATAWALATLAVIAVLARLGRLRSIRRSLGTQRPLRAPIPAILIILTIMVVLFAVAVTSPPNNVDSLLYHMPRVRHWEQNGSLSHYATGYQHQLIMPPFAEIANLHLSLLYGSDRLANLVQWSAMAASVLLASGIAARLGAGMLGSLLAAAVSVSIPMGILQSTSTQNDYVVALWSLVALYHLVAALDRKLTPVEIAVAGGALGLGVLTKVTFYPYGLVIGAAIVACEMKRSTAARSLGVAAIFLLSVIALNAGVWLRNLDTYGGLYGPPEWMTSNLAIASVIEAGQPTAPDQVAIHGLGELAFRAARSAVQTGDWLWRRTIQAMALHLLTPVGRLNRIAILIVDSFQNLFGSSTASYLEAATWNHEDTAGNPIHLAVGFISLLLFARDSLARRSPSRALVLFLVVGACFVLLVLIVGPASTEFGVRYHLPLFLLMAPLIALASVRHLDTWLARAVIYGFLVTAIPYVLLNNTRPVIGRTPWPTRVSSVFSAAPEELLFAMNPSARQPYSTLANRLGESGCTQIGMRLDSSDPEYFFWWLLDRQGGDYRLETVYTFEPLERYRDPEFEPCAIVCTICGQRESLDNLEIAESLRGVNLYLDAAHR